MTCPADVDFTALWVVRAVRLSRVNPVPSCQPKWPQGYATGHTHTVVLSIDGRVERKPSG